MNKSKSTSAEDMLKRQLAFGKLMNKIHDRLAKAAGKEIDAHIQKTLREVGRFIGVDSVFVMQYAADQKSWSWTSEWHDPAVSSFLKTYQQIPAGQFKYSEKLLRQNKILLIKTLADFPPTAAFERKRYSKEGVKSMLSVPLYGREKMVVGCIGFRSYSRRILWAREEDIRWIKMIGDAIAGALVRQRFEQELLSYRDHLEQLVEERTKRLKLVLESGQFEIWSWSADKNYFNVSAGAADMIGVDSVTGKIMSRESYRQFIHRDDLPKLTKLRDAAYCGDIDQYQCEYRLRHKDKGWLWVLSIVVVESRAADKTAIKMSGLLQDITVRKHAEEALKKYSEGLEEIVRLRTAELLQSQKMEAIGTLAGGIAHDFNNILGGILGYMELAQRRHVAAEHQASSYIEGAIQGIHRASDLISQITTFSRSEEQRRKPLEMHPLIKEALKLLLATLPSTIEIRQNIVSSQRAILADPTQIHQIIMNLCTNAAHAMKEKGGIMEVSLRQVIFESNKHLPHHDLKTSVEYEMLIVRDTGYGINEEIINRIFDPFFTTKKPGEGTGLGLAVVYGIIRNHGGAITVESKLGKGTVFYVYLPTIPQTMEDIDESKGAIYGGKESILFVDDETSLTAIFKIQLEDLGYRVDVHNDPRAALDAFKRNPSHYDLVITDLTMPHMVGTNLATKLSRIRADVPIVLLTGVIDKIELNYLRRHGICKMILKPISLRKLAQAIRQVLDENKNISC